MFILYIYIYIYIYIYTVHIFIHVSICTNTYIYIYVRIPESNISKISRDIFSGMTIPKKNYRGNNYDNKHIYVYIL
jgi:hypothetical protein